MNNNFRQESYNIMYVILITNLLILNYCIVTKICYKINIPFDLTISSMGTGFGYELTTIITIIEIYIYYQQLKRKNSMHNNNMEKITKNIKMATDLTKMKILIYIFEQINQNKIKRRNNHVKVFNFKILGYPTDFCKSFLQYNIIIYNILSKNDKIKEQDGKIKYIIYTKFEKKITKQFKKLSFEQKLDLISEIIIAYDNETYFSEKITFLNFDDKRSGEDIAKLIQHFKIN